MRLSVSYGGPLLWPVTVCQLRWPVTVRQFLSGSYNGPLLWPVTVCQLRWIVISLGTDVGYVGQTAGWD